MAHFHEGIWTLSQVLAWIFLGERKWVEEFAPENLPKRHALVECKTSSGETVLAPHYVGPPDFMTLTAASCLAENAGYEDVFGAAEALHKACLNGCLVVTALDPRTGERRTMTGAELEHRSFAMGPDVLEGEGAPTFAEPLFRRAEVLQWWPDPNEDVDHANGFTGRQMKAVPVGTIGLVEASSRVWRNCLPLDAPTNAPVTRTVFDGENPFLVSYRGLSSDQEEALKSADKQTNDLFFGALAAGVLQVCFLKDGERFGVPEAYWNLASARLCRVTGLLHVRPDEGGSFQEFREMAGFIMAEAFDRWFATLPPRPAPLNATPAPKNPTDAARQMLEAMMLQHEERPEPKEKIRTRISAQTGISRRTFDSLWKETTRKLNRPKWNASGRPRKSSHGAR